MGISAVVTRADAAVVPDDGVPSPDPAPTGADRVATAALACIARDGVRATTVEAIAAEAGVGRASVYRWYPGGRAEVLVAGGWSRLSGHLHALAATLRQADDLEDVLALALSGGVRLLRDDPVLRQLLDREPALVLPLLAFDEMRTAFAVGARLLVPHLARVAPDLDGRRTAELITRLVLSHTVHPSPDRDLAEVGVARTHIRTLVLPGVRAGTRTAPR